MSGSYNCRIQKFTSDGIFIAQWDSPLASDGQLSSPNRVAIAGSGYVYVSDNGNHRIQKFTSDGGFITKWGSSVQITVNLIP